jgi:hypothetical protein
MRRILAVLGIVAVAVSGCTTTGSPGLLGRGSADAPTETTIAAVKAEPGKFQDKYLRLRGLIYCWHVGCSLLAVAPGTIPPNDHPQSLPIGFDGMDKDVFDVSSPASRAYADENRAGRVIKEAYVFSEATVEGLYHPAECPQEAGAIVDCAIGAADFEVTKIVAVHKRWPSTVFPVGAGGEDFRPLPPETAKTMALAYDKAAELAGDDPRIASSQYRAFTTGSDMAVLCICRVDRCDGAWPRSDLQVIASPNNPFKCVDAKSIEGQWRFPPGPLE